jgi:hypothetical protein
MRRLGPSGEAEMVALFLRTELSSDRFGADIRVLLERDGVPEHVVSAPDLGDAAENQVRLRILTEQRGYGNRTDYFEGFPDDVRWQWMAITPAELAGPAGDRRSRQAGGRRLLTYRMRYSPARTAAPTPPRKRISTPTVYRSAATSPSTPITSPSRMARATTPTFLLLMRPMHLWGNLWMLPCVPGVWLRYT